MTIKIGKKISQYKLDPTLNWSLVEIVSLNNEKLRFKSIKNKKIRGRYTFKKYLLDIKAKKKIEEVYDIGDIIFVKKENNMWQVKQYPRVNGGIIVLDPYNGDVLALVGGFNFKKSEFNRVTQAKRQPGSAFKPIVYAAALENGFAPNTIILDAPFVENQGVGLKKLEA